MSTIKFATWNVNGIRAREKELMTWLEQEKPDVICLQELKSTTAQVPEVLCNLQGYDCYWHGARAYSGVGLHIRREAFPEPARFYHPEFDFETRIVVAQIADLHFISVYVPNGGKEFAAKMDFLHALEGFVAGLHSASSRVILGGDLNIARTPMDVHPKERNEKKVGQLPEERELLESILKQGLVDVGRALDPDNENLFTWWAPWRQLRQRNIGWRIDYVLASASLAAKAVQCTAHREVGTSDHGPVVATFALD